MAQKEKYWFYLYNFYDLILITRTGTTEEHSTSVVKYIIYEPYCIIDLNVVSSQRRFYV